MGRGTYDIGQLYLVRGVFAYTGQGGCPLPVGPLTIQAASLAQTQSQPRRWAQGKEGRGERGREGEGTVQLNWSQSLALGRGRRLDVVHTGSNW